MLATLLLAAAAATFPTLKQVPTGAPALNASPSVTKFTFVVAGDNRPADATDGLTKPFTDIVVALKNTPPAFVVWNGDTVYGKQLSGVDTQYSAFLGAFDTLAVPIFNAPGNHEMVHVTCNQSGEFPYQDMVDAYKKSMAAPYGIFRYGNAALVVVNTDDLLDVTMSDPCQYNGYVSKAQLSSLEATLSALESDKTVTHTFLFMHRPIHDSGSHQIGNGKDDTSAYGTQVQAFRKAIDHNGYKKLLFVFASHDHRFYLNPSDAKLSGTSPGSGAEPTFLVTGGAGAPLSGCKNGGSGNPGAYYHYLTVNVNGSNVTITQVPLYGTTLCGAPGGV